MFLSLAITAVVTLVAQWANEGYYIKENELVVRRGIIHKTEISYPYANMQSVSVQQGFFGRLFNFGLVTIFIPTLGKDILFNEISAPKKFAQILKDHIPYAESGQFLIRK
ncbi:PH domain-containing protein [Candidatus Nomurabacteria bacterium]|nr:PH domain-containing protein [Candidatus Nomurabacteria bacterium]